MKVGKILTPAFLVTIKVAPMNTWISFTQKRDSTKLLEKRLQAWNCLEKIPSARKILWSLGITSQQPSIAQCGFVFFPRFLLGFSYTAEKY